MRTSSRNRRHGMKRDECGSMILEVLIAIVVLAVGMGALIPLLISSMYTNNRSGQDTTSTMLAEHVIEQISALPANSNNTLQILDCKGTVWTVAPTGAITASGTGGSYGGNGAHLTSGGIIDWTQDYASVPTNYKMKYVACGAGGRQTIYDVRWDIISMLNLTGNNYTRMVIVSARPAASQTVGGLRYVVPVNLRTIGGM
jgi:type II secretory pathway pseudopilin PulG